MRLQSQALTVFAALGILLSIARVQATEEKPTRSIQGAWSVTKMVAADGTTSGPAQPGVFIFTRKHYSAVFTLGTEPRSPAATSFSPTKEEMVDQFERIIVNTGTYEISGSTITTRPLVAKSPGFIGGHSTMEYQLDDDVLTLTTTAVVAADGTKATGVVGDVMTLRRLE